MFVYKSIYASKVAIFMFVYHIFVDNCAYRIGKKRIQTSRICFTAERIRIRYSVEAEYIIYKSSGKIFIYFSLKRIK